MSDPFDDADFYDCCEDCEELSHETVEDAIAAHIDDRGPGDILADIVAATPLTVYAYKREVVSESWLASASRVLAAHLDELWGEEYGDPDGRNNPDEEQIAAALFPGIAAAVKPWRVWRCKEVATREYSAAEVEALMRAANPDWFEVKP